MAVSLSLCFLFYMLSKLGRVFLLQSLRTGSYLRKLLPERESSGLSGEETPSPFPPRPHLLYNAGRLSVSAADTDCSIPQKVNIAAAAGVKLCFHRNYRRMRTRGAHENQQKRGYT